MSSLAHRVAQQLQPRLQYPLRHRLRSDEALMLAYRKGDVSAFECLYARHKDELFSFIYRSGGHGAAIEEVAQEAWEAVVRSATRYVPSASFRTWLYQIARQRLADYWRRRDNRHALLSDQDIPEAADSSAEPAAEHDNFSAIEARVMRAIGTLPLEQRDALLLKEQGFSLAEIADITGDGQETVKSRLRYARAQLREQLGDEL
ncbi:MAG: sigma-70 family RNA polymerase sigma factor [Gammaproteobacteria bacterium]|nr:sigma-70 family RNA polymerase sigma factor [Gammaproteobacteria bacterium]